ncbi:MAG: hypothetical protein E7517_06975 [Ruminococcaceae bacterium]|nr:hypothetical protein [Oscillospiraceae bacterium]
MKKKIILTAGIVVAVIAIGCVVCAVLYSNGLLGFYHPQQQAKEGQVKIACVGDSITYGYGVKQWQQNNYPAQLQDMLGEGFCVNNFGYSGRTAQTTGDRPYGAEKLYEQSKEFAPDIVIFMLGSNDSKAFNWNKDNFMKDYKALVESYQNLPNHPKVIVMAPPPVFEAGGKVKYHIEKDTIAKEIVPLTKKLAKEIGVPCIDLYTIFEEKPQLFSDGCHPTAAGAKIIADTVRTQLSKELIK